MTLYCTLDTPVGPLTLLTNDNALMAAGWCAAPELWGRLSRRPGGAPGELSPGISGNARTVLTDYFAGDVEALGDVQIRQRGTAHQERVWNALFSIPRGETSSYGRLADQLGTSSRALGTACGANLIAPVVPCHRVVRADGSLGGYYYGLEVKQWLLRHEQRS